MKQHKPEQVWIGVEDLSNSPAFSKLAQDEFQQVSLTDPGSQEALMDTGSSRRDFLKYLGFGLGAATVAAACDTPVRRAIPYVVKPDTIVPGVASYYASSFVQGGDYCAVLVKTREGRPIKIEGNSLSKVTKGGTSARAQASVLSLYDNSRFQGPMVMADGRSTAAAWADMDKAIVGGLNESSRIRIVSHTLLSPTAKQVIEEFAAKYPATKHVIYDPVSSSAILEANAASFGQRLIPDYRFDKAMVIVSLGADFLGTWISPVEYAADYAVNRKIKDVKSPKMSRHIQVESYMSLTGSNADTRVLIKPSEQGAAIAALYNEVAALTGGSRVSAPALGEKAAEGIKKAAAELVAAKGASLVVSGSNNVGEQTLINAINSLLGNYGATISFHHASLQRQGIDGDVQGLIRDMNAGTVDAVIFIGDANPAWELPNAAAFKEALAKVKLKISTAGAPDETTALCDYVAPSHHFLESWGDAEPKRGHFSLMQPTIAPLFNTRQAEHSLLTWAAGANINNTAEQPYLEYLSAAWQSRMFPRQNAYATFQAFWDSCLHDGVFEATPEAIEVVFAGDASAAAGKINQPSNAEMEIAFYETVNMGAGQYANNPWLMEMPDPLTRCVWGNYLAVPVSWNGGNSWTAYKDLSSSEIYGEADKVEVELNGVKQIVTAVRQFGQLPGTVSLALGYGREVVGKAGKNVGVNVQPWLGIDANGNTQYYAAGVTVSDSVDKEAHLACVQYHHTMGVSGVDPASGEKINVDEKTIATLGSGYQGALVDRSIIRRTTLKELPEFVEHLHEERHEAQELNSKSLYPGHEYKYNTGHHWAMYVDLNACTGCGACTVACMAENNVPIVGKREVSRHHEMTWLRIDRYFYGDYENPNVVYQPMLCQHCDNAPCENVCPVAATNHSSEGLNQMTYNRCIGTRYCANNCPYKVRRFNWLDYTAADLFPINQNSINGEDPAYYTDNLVRMVLNPDVTVRSRGVIEKCSFCVQRIQEGKLTAKREMRSLMDSDVRTACQTACPTGAIIFGDRNNKTGDLGKIVDAPLNYLMLEEINAAPSVFYSARVVNKEEEAMG